MPHTRHGVHESEQLAELYQLELVELLEEEAETVAEQLVEEEPFEDPAEEGEADA